MGYDYSQIRWSRTKLKNVILTYRPTQKQKTGATHAVKYWIQCSIYSKHFNSLLRRFISSSSLYFQARTALRSLMMLIFSELKWNRSLRPKAAWARSFLLLLDCRKKSPLVNTKQREEQLLSMCAYGKAQAKLFLWPTLVPK